MATEISPQSRIQVIDVPILAPGVCMVCGTAGVDDRKFIDFGKQVDWYGAVYLCSECIIEVARAIGFIPVAEFDKLLEEYKKIQADKGMTDAKAEGIQSALDVLFAGYNGGIVSIDEFVRGPVSTVDKSSGVPESNEEPNKRESETDEPSDVEGSDDIFDDSDFE